MSSQNETWAIPKGSTVLVTGANGYLASHVVDQFLQRGFNVRGTVRDVTKDSWLRDLFKQKYSAGRFELREVPDLAAEGALNEVIKGVSAVAHVASDTTLGYDPTQIIPKVEAFAVNALKATYGQSSVKRFVLCSSSWAASAPSLDKLPAVITEETWEEDAVKAAWAEPPYLPDRVIAVYTASKVAAEKAVWKYHNDHRGERPDLVVNAVLPSFTVGKSLDPIRQGFRSTGGATAQLWKGEVGDFHRMTVRQYFINSEDIGRLHVAAAIFDNVRDQRIFGYAGRVSWDAILGIFRKLEPEKNFVADFSGGEDPAIIKSRDKAEGLLRDLGQPGWTSLEQSVADLIEGVKEADAHGETASG